MSQKAEVKTESLDGQDFQRGQRVKGVIALVAVAVAIVFLLIGFAQMGAV